MRFLIIEDDASIRRLLEAVVSARADAIASYETGEDGLAAARLEKPDFVLLDLNLRGLYDGFEVCARLRADPATRTVPILIISARADQDSREKAMRAGASAYHTKPFRPSALLKEIEELAGPTPPRAAP